MRRFPRAVALAGIAGATLAFGPPALAQSELRDHEAVAFDRPEAWGMQFATAAATFGALDAARELERGAVELAFVAGSVPGLSPAERRIGFNGTKQEAIDRAPAVGRLSATFGLGAGLGLELNAIPPVELDGIEPRVAGAALLARRSLSDRYRFGARLGYDRGTLTGDITCSLADVAAGDDPLRNPFGCEAPSADRFELAQTSLELLVSRRSGTSRRPEPYLSLSVHRLDGNFAVRASYNGIVDRTVLSTRGTFWSAALGAAAELGDGWRLAGELRWAPLSIQRPGQATADQPLRSLRIALAWRLR